MFQLLCLVLYISWHGVYWVMTKNVVLVWARQAKGLKNPAAGPISIFISFQQGTKRQAKRTEALGCLLADPEQAP